MRRGRVNCGCCPLVLKRRVAFSGLGAAGAGGSRSFHGGDTIMGWRAFDIRGRKKVEKSAFDPGFGRVGEGGARWLVSASAIKGREGRELCDVGEKTPAVLEYPLG